ncbi:MAG: ribosome silencing factor [Desulfobacteraceae bacterium]|nr:MAG: ribosome silencing factor [Desulfobacteraceae bacterium]
MTVKKTQKAEQDTDKSIELYVNAVLGKKALNIVALDVRGLTSVADFFIVCSGRSNRQVAAIADFVERTLKKAGIKPLSVEGKNEGLWVLLDYGDVIIHVFYETVRKFYDLEGLWSDAKRVVTDSMTEKTNNIGESEIYVE